jgi:hypothetical protein
MAELNTLEREALRAARSGLLADAVQRIAIEPDSNRDGDEYLRVLVSIDALRQQSTAELISMIDGIQDALIPLDRRFPSVRLRDAA